jgi:AcrR family transcriptional regulator
MVRQAILEAAREIMRTDGVGALSINEVARRVGMKPPSLYTYFESKHALYDQLFREGMRAYHAQVRELMDQSGVSDGFFEAAVRHYMTFADENPELYALLFERPVPGFVPSEESMVEARALLEDGERWFQDALDAGVIRTGLSAAETRDLALALMHGLTALRRANEPDAPAGGGRFAPLIPAAVALIRAAWMPTG